MRGYGIPVEFVAIQDDFGTSARNYNELLDQYHLTSGAIKAAIEKVCG
jgi:transketolase C-terminal domain/subunit